MGAIKVEKTVRLNRFEIVKYQLIHHCFMNRIKLTDTELNCLALLGEIGSIRLTEFAKRAVEKEFLGNSVSVTNCLSKIRRSNLFIEKGVGKKVIFLNPDLNIKSEGTLVIELKLIKLDEANVAAGNLQNNRKEAQPA